MLAVAVVLCAAALAVYQDSATTLRLLLSPDALLALLGVNAAIFLWRTHCVVDAYRVAGRRRALSRGPSGTLGGRTAAVLVLLALISLPHVVAGYYTYRDYDLLTSVFAEEEPVVVVAAEPPVRQVVVPRGSSAPWVGQRAAGPTRRGRSSSRSPSRSRRRRSGRSGAG